MSEQKINKNNNLEHKYGPIKTENDGTFYRNCLCCSPAITIKFPRDEDFKEEITKQENALWTFDILTYYGINTIQSSDDYINLIGLLLDSLDYLYINEEQQKQYIEKINLFNEYFKKKDNYRYNLVEDFKKYVQSHFSKENAEIKMGMNILKEEKEELDDLFLKINTKITKEIENIFNKREKNNHTK